MKDTVILYHANCTDGFGAAFAAWKKFKDRATYLPVEHQVPPPEGLKNKAIYMVDFCYKAPTLKKLTKANREVIVLDHHIGVKDDMKEATSHVFQNNHSGSVIAWNYFHPKKKTPRLLLHIEDTDLWKFKVPHTREVSAALELVPFDFKTWDRIMKGYELLRTRKKFIEKGKNIREYQIAVVRRVVLKAQEVEFEGYRTFVANSPVLASEIGHTLVLKRPPIAIVWSQDRKRINVSLRSDGTVDVSLLAKKYGGGGHRSASGFTFPAKFELPWKNV
jgi:nanoRNase/pAp phosphatase (c-di-AMP/oligoRNAs hydrolase)